MGKLTHVKWTTLTTWAAQQDIAAIAIQEHGRLAWGDLEEDLYTTMFEDCPRASQNSHAGGVGWAVRRGKEHWFRGMEGPGPKGQVAWLMLSMAKGEVGLASVYVPPGGEATGALQMAEGLDGMAGPEAWVAMGDINANGRWISLWLRLSSSHGTWRWVGTFCS